MGKFNEWSKEHQSEVKETEGKSAQNHYAKLIFKLFDNNDDEVTCPRYIMRDTLRLMADQAPEDPQNKLVARLARAIAAGKDPVMDNKTFFEVVRSIPELD